MFGGNVFSDEKPFTIEEDLKAQNDRVYAATIEDIPQQARAVQRFQKPGFVMICGAVSITPAFVEAGVKANATYNREAIRQHYLKTEAQGVFRQRQWIFQKNSSPGLRRKNHHD